ncbi:hypothetical protein [Pseudosulfitobacter koreensis]|uniref:Sel1 repeat-containing protein n=1 Tax=Pseudosulfitobacter koreensis TaxID=2968472 RepID=A0ABT1YXF6_9RHOB|nr:hypothetical protein [Pseudosulfitobacter koreense]MCR8825575.1 hypothetical protein [Pseudosulfitobacter koreense]
MRHLVSISVSALICCALSVGADPLPEPLESKRQAAIVLSEKACDGDVAGLRALEKKAAAGDLAAAHSIAWVVSNNRCPTYGMVGAGQDRDEVGARMYARNATRGYPISQSNHGINLMRGSNGIPRDPETGARMIGQAVDGGYAIALVYSTEAAFQEGLEVEMNPMVGPFLAFAVEEGVDPDRVRLARASVFEELYKNGGDDHAWAGFLAYRYFERVQSKYARARKSHAALEDRYGHVAGTKELQSCLNDAACDPYARNVMRSYFTSEPAKPSSSGLGLPESEAILNRYICGSDVCPD